MTSAYHNVGGKWLPIPDDVAIRYVMERASLREALHREIHNECPHCHGEGFVYPRGEGGYTRRACGCPVGREAEREGE
jgi:Ribonuclease G/E